MKLGKYFGLTSVVICSIWLLYKCAPDTYPVRVSFEFRYAGESYKNSYLTITTKGSGQWPISPYSWSHGRDKISVALSDGSIIVLRTPWNYFDLDPPKVTIPPTKTGWIWLNNASAPTELISGGNYPEQAVMPNAPSSFPQFDVTATIERMSWTFYLAAKEEDNKKDDAVDRVLLTSFWGGPLASSGLLFAGLRMSPIRASDNLSQQNIDKIRGEAGWISVSDICQMKPLTHATPLAALFDYAASHELLLKDGIWTANGGPGTTGPIILYSTHQNVENKHMNDGLFYDYSQEIFPMVKNVQWADEICRNIILPSGSQRAILDFKNSGLFLLAPSDDIAILR